MVVLYDYKGETAVTTVGHGLLPNLVSVSVKPVEPGISPYLTEVAATLLSSKLDIERSALWIELFLWKPALRHCRRANKPLAALGAVANQNGGEMSTLNEPDRCCGAADLKTRGDSIDGGKVRLFVASGHRVKNIAGHEKIGGKAIRHSLHVVLPVAPAQTNVRCATKERLAAMVSPMTQLVTYREALAGRG